MIGSPLKSQLISLINTCKHAQHSLLLGLIINIVSDIAFQNLHLFLVAASLSLHLPTRILSLISLLNPIHLPRGSYSSFGNKFPQSFRTLTIKHLRSISNMLPYFWLFCLHLFSRYHPCYSSLVDLADSGGVSACSISANREWLHANYNSQR